MEKTTVLAWLRLTLKFNRATLRWLHRIPDSWLAREEGPLFLSEHGHTREPAFVESVEPEIKTYFAELGVPSNSLPFVRIGERYRGSWVLEAAVVMAGTVGTAYTILKGVSELPDIADGLTKLKDRLVKRTRSRLDESIRGYLTRSMDSQAESTAALKQLPPPPSSVVDADLVIDAGPILSLSPAITKAHKVHLSVAVSRDCLVLENLGEEPLRDVRLGLFRTRTQRHQWTYQDSYMGEVPLLSSHQTLTKRLAEFRDGQGNLLDMSDGEAAHVDCWVEDSHGIYLFRFHLEEEP